MSKTLQVSFAKKDEDYQKYASQPLAIYWGRTFSQADTTNGRSVISALPCSSQITFFD
jgi:hypothetical protein